MKRREFIKKSITTGVVAGSAFSMLPYQNLFGARYNPVEDFDLVAIKGGEPHLMFDTAIESLGGMKKFVKSGQKVVVKPNIGWDAPPERAANTNPKLIGRIVEHCYNAGAKEVLVFDNTCNDWNKCYSNSGIERAVKDAGGKMVPANTEGYYQNIDVSNGKSLKASQVHEVLLESDVFINVPVLKHHASADLSIAMKNLMGIIWDRRYWHRNDLHQCIADFTTYSKPDLNIIDAYRVMQKNGPRGVSVDDVGLYKAQIISADIVAADASATKLFGTEPEDVDYIKIADQMGVGTMDLKSLNIKKIML